MRKERGGSNCLTRVDAELRTRHTWESPVRIAGPPFAAFPEQGIFCVRHAFSASRARDFATFHGSCATGRLRRATAIIGRVAASLLAVSQCGLGIGTIWRGARGTHTGTRQSDRGAQGRARMPQGVPLLQVRIYLPRQGEKGGGLGVSRMPGAGLPKLPILPSLRESARLFVPHSQLHRRRIWKVSCLRQNHPIDRKPALNLWQRKVYEIPVRWGGAKKTRTGFLAGLRSRTVPCYAASSIVQQRLSHAGQAGYNGGRYMAMQVFRPCVKVLVQGR